MDPIETLNAEHRSIELVLQALFRASALVQSGRRVPPRLFVDTVHFIRQYVDGVHHEKEERYLFPMLERAGLPRDDGPLACLLAEHDDARRYTNQIWQEAELARNGGVAGSTLLYQAASAYARHMVAHIQKEDAALFIMARRAIDEDGMAQLRAAFERIDAHSPGLDASAVAIAAQLEQAPSLR